MSVNATAVCLEYPKYFFAVSPADVSKVLNIELGETWAILYELASLFDTSEDSIRSFHASYGDFLFDSSRSGDFFRNGGDIAADITCAMLRQGRDPEGTRQFFVLLPNSINSLLVLSYHAFSRLLGEATPRQDLKGILSQMEPLSIFRRPAITREYDQRSKGAYYLIPLLRRLGNHVVNYFCFILFARSQLMQASSWSSNAYKSLVTYFDQQYRLFLPLGYWSSNFSEDDDDNDDGDDADTDDDYADNENEHVLGMVKARATRSVSYRVSNSKLTPLSTSPAWDEINASLNIRLTGSDSLTGVCDEARFVRLHLKKTMSVLLEGSTQAKAALFCTKQIQSEDITKDLQIAFAKLLPYSLLHAEQLPELNTAIQQLSTQRLIYQRLPVETRKAITDYLLSTSGSRPSDTITKSSTQDNLQIHNNSGSVLFSSPSNVQINGNTFDISFMAQPSSSAVSEHLVPSQVQNIVINGDTFAISSTA